MPENARAPRYAFARLHEQFRVAAERIKRVYQKNYVIASERCRRRFRHVEEKHEKARFQTERTGDVRRSRVAAALFADVFSEKQPPDYYRVADRTEQIGEDRDPDIYQNLHVPRPPLRLLIG